MIMFEKFLHQTPFVRFVFPMLAGILFKIFFPTITAPYFEFALVLFVIALIIDITKLSFRRGLNKLFGILVFLVLLFTGASLVQTKQQNKPWLPNEKYTYTAVITENPEIKENSVKAVFEITGIKDSDIKNALNTKVLVYFQKDSTSVNLIMGDLLLAKSQISEVNHSGNPEAFNFKRYLSYKEI